MYNHLNCFSHFMKRPLQLFAFALALLLQNPVKAQTTSPAPQNFPAMFAGIEFNGSSAPIGIEYERTFPAKGQAQFGVSGVYVFRYNVGAIGIWGDENPEYRSMGMLMGTGTLFVSKRKKQAGFFLHGGLGAGLTSHQLPGTRFHKLHAVGDIGPGWHIPFDATVGMRIGPSVLFASHGGIVRLKLAFGF